MKSLERTADMGEPASLYRITVDRSRYRFRSWSDLKPVARRRWRKRYRESQDG